MTTRMQPAAAETGTLTLLVRRTIRATPARLFEAWTTPAQFVQWWGPEGVTCPRVEMDLRVGGAYRIGNRLPDGNELWIAGTFERIAPPNELVFSWKMEHSDFASERVTVRFEARGTETEVIVFHERLRDEATRADHEHGWTGCLDGLVAYLTD
jgi:uncharacterized protein YndB with AHSA1/START domain